MMKIQIFICCLVFTLVSCVDFNAPKKPKNLIPKDKMVNIIIDSRLVANVSGTNYTSLLKKGYNLDTYVFKKYGIDSLQFAQSNAYYAYHIKTYDEIYKKVIDSLTLLSKELTKKQTDLVNETIKKAREQPKKEAEVNNLKK